MWNRQAIGLAIQKYINEVFSSEYSCWRNQMTVDRFVPMTDVSLFYAHIVFSCPDESAPKATNETPTAPPGTDGHSIPTALPPDKHTSDSASRLTTGESVNFCKRLMFYGF